MIVGIDATCWSNPRGYGRYARGLLTALLAEPAPHRYVFFVDAQTKATCPMPDGVEYAVAQTSQAPTEAASAEGRRSIGDMLAMGAAVSRARLDAFFFPSVYTYFPVRTRAKVILGIHDIIAEKYPQLVFPNRSNRWLWMAKGWLARRQADAIVAVSDHARDGIMQKFGVPAGKVWVVGEAPDAVFRPIADEGKLREGLGKVFQPHLPAHLPHPPAPSPQVERGGKTDWPRYVMCLGGLNPHKNLGMLLEVMADLRRETAFSDVQLVLVGPAESDTFTPGAATMREQVKQLGLAGAVHFTGYIPDEDVACLLNTTQGLVMPSLDEGFGLGAVEAAACGTPVIATRNSPLPRLLEGGGWFIDPLRPDELRAALTEMLGDEPERMRRGQVALERSQALTWGGAARAFLGMLEGVTSNELWVESYE